MKLLLALSLVFLALPSADAAVTDCVVQAFGRGLRRKGIQVHVPARCAEGKHYGEARFDSTGEAEVPLRLHVTASGTCNIEVFLLDDCVTLPRTSTSNSWKGNLAPGGGQCIAFEKWCSGDTPPVTIGAIPYIDMWCRTPAGLGLPFEGQAQQIKLSWNLGANDRC